MCTCPCCQKWERYVGYLDKGRRNDPTHLEEMRHRVDELRRALALAEEKNRALEGDVRRAEDVAYHASFRTGGAW